MANILPPESSAVIGTREAEQVIFNMSCAVIGGREGGSWREKEEKEEALERNGWRWLHTDQGVT